MFELFFAPQKLSAADAAEKFSGNEKLATLVREYTKLQGMIGFSGSAENDPSLLSQKEAAILEFLQQKKVTLESAPDPYNHEIDDSFRQFLLAFQRESDEQLAA